MMVPPALAAVQRFAGLFVSLSLILSPWLLALECEDLFLNQSWLLIFLGMIAISFMAVQHIFYCPRHGQIPWRWAILLCFAFLTISTLNSNFLISLRLALVLATQLLLLFFLRLVRRGRDTIALVMILVMNGAAISVYALAQSMGRDLLIWCDSPHLVVGPFSNPNFLGAYLMVTGILALGMYFHPQFSNCKWRVFFITVFLIHLTALFLSHAKGAWICLVLGILLLATRFWEITSIRIRRYSQFVGGVLLAIVLIAGYWLAVVATRNYPWDSLHTVPYGTMRSIITRLLEWQMGFSVFLNHPWIGIGPGGMSYLMSSFRPPLGIFLGLAPYNDDPHSHVILLLGEFGIFGLWAFCSLVVTVWGIHGRFRSKVDANSLANELSVSPEASLSYPNTNSYHDNNNNNISSESVPFQATDLAANNYPITKYGSEYFEYNGWLAKILAAATLVLFVHGMFNNSLSILPLSNLLLILVSLHQSICLRDLVWKRCFRWKSLLGLFLPFAFTAIAWALQNNHQTVSRALFAGRQLLKEGKVIEAEAAFERALKANPQSIHGLWGLAQALERQGRLARVQDLLGRLDALGPNIFGAKYQIARILFERQKLLEAHRYAIMALNMNHTPSIYELMSRILIKEGRISEAEQMLREGLLFVPAWVPEERFAADRIRLQLAAITIDQAKFDEATKLLASISDSIEMRGEIKYLSGVIEYRQGNATSALKLFEEALQQNASDPKYLNAVGYLLVETGQQLDRAQILLENAYREYRSRTPPLLSDILAVAHSLGRLYWKKGQLDKAQELLTMAFQECPLEWKDVREERARDLRKFFQETGRSSSILLEKQNDVSKP